MLNESLKVETVKEEHVKQIQTDLPSDSNQQVVDASNAKSVPSGSNRKRRRHNLISPEKNNKRPKQEMNILDLNKEKEKVNQKQPGSRLRSLSSSSSGSSDDGSGSRSRSSSSSESDKDFTKLNIDDCIKNSKLTVKNSKKHIMYMRLLKKRMAEEKRDYESLKEVNKNLENEKKELTKDNSILKDEKNGLKEEIKHNNIKHSFQQDEIKDLKVKLSLRKQIRENLLSEKSDLMKIMNIPQEKRDYVSLKKAIDDLLKEKERQTKDNSKLKNDLLQEKERYKQLNKKLDTLKKNIEEQTNDNSELKKEIKRLKINRLEQKSDLMNIMNIPKERRDYETLKRAIEDLKEEKEKQKRDNLETFNNCIELTSQHSDLMEIMEIPQKERNYESLRNSIVNLKNEKEKQTKDNSKLKDENDKLNINIAKVESLYDEQEQNRLDLCEIMKISKEAGDYEVLKKAIEDLKNKKEEQTSDNSKLKETNDELKEIREKLELKQNHLMMIMNIPQGKENYESLKKAIEKQKEQNEALQSCQKLLGEIMLNNMPEDKRDSEALVESVKKLKLKSEEERLSQIGVNPSIHEKKSNLEKEVQSLKEKIEDLEEMISDREHKIDLKDLKIKDLQDRCNKEKDRADDLAVQVPIPT